MIACRHAVTVRLLLVTEIGATATAVKRWSFPPTSSSVDSCFTFFPIGSCGFATTDFCLVASGEQSSPRSANNSDRPSHRRQNKRIPLSNGSERCWGSTWKRVRVAVTCCWQRSYLRRVQPSNCAVPIGTRAAHRRSPPNDDRCQEQTARPPLGYRYARPLSSSWKSHTFCSDRPASHATEHAAHLPRVLKIVAPAKLTRYNLQAVSRHSYAAQFNMFYRPSLSRRRDKTLLVIRLKPLRFASILLARPSASSRIEYRQRTNHER